MVDSEQKRHSAFAAIGCVILIIGIILAVFVGLMLPNAKFYYGEEDFERVFDNTAHWDYFVAAVYLGSFITAATIIDGLVVTAKGLMHSGRKPLVTASIALTAIISILTIAAIIVTSIHENWCGRPRAGPTNLELQTACDLAGDNAVVVVVLECLATIAALAGVATLHHFKDTEW